MPVSLAPYSTDFALYLKGPIAGDSEELGDAAGLQPAWRVRSLRSGIVYCFILNLKSAPGFDFFA